MKWALVQRWSAIVLLALIVVNAHVGMPSVEASKALSFGLLLAGATHLAASLYVVLTDYRPFASKSRTAAVAAAALGVGAAAYGGAVIARTEGPKPILGHLPGSECRACHDRDEHTRWPLALHAPKDGKPGVDCEGCHGVGTSSRHLLAYREAESKKHVAVASAVEMCLECHSPRANITSVWAGTIHADVKCGTCHSHNTTPENPSWKRACVKCHPHEDDPHGDVRTLDTTYLRPSSWYDIHTVSCASCHANAPATQVRSH